MFNFNDKVDLYALKPAADRLQATWCRRSCRPGSTISSATSATSGPRSTTCCRARWPTACPTSCGSRVNTTLGLGGLLDIGSEAGLPKHNEDFGQTLGVWGVQSGPYVVLPLLGSSTMRDTVALPVDFAGDPWSYVNPDPTRNIGTGVRVIDLRAVLLDASNLIEDAALDRYEFIRDAYLQRRASKISSNGERGADATYRALPEDDGLDTKSDNSSSVEWRRMRHHLRNPRATRMPNRKRRRPRLRRSGNQPAFIPAPSGETAK